MRAHNIYKLLSDLRKNEEVESSYPFGEYLHVTLKNGDERYAGELRGYAEKQGHTHIEVKDIEPTIEDSFIRLMNEKKEPVLPHA